MENKTKSLEDVAMALPYARLIVSLMLLGPLLGLAALVIGFNVPLLLKVSLSNLTFSMLALIVAPNLRIWVKNK
jgi:hypothetical protein